MSIRLLKQRVLEMRYSVDMHCLETIQIEVGSRMVAGLKRHTTLVSG